MENLKKHRKQSNLKQVEVATALGIATNTYSQYENGKRQPNITMLKEMARYFNTSVDELIGLTNEKPQNTQIIHQISKMGSRKLAKISEYIDEINENENKYKIKILGQVAAGHPILAITDDEDYVYSDTKADFALRVKGDSMEPEISDDGLVLIRKQSTIENGQIGVVQVDYDSDTSEVTCKKIYVHQDHIELVSLNKKYDPIVLDPNNHLRYQVLGKVVAYT